MKSNLQYDNEHCNQFVRDMEDAGYEVEHYRGRFFWEGPACRTVDGEVTAHDIIRATRVSLQQDDMGLGSIHYPVARGKRLEE